MKGLGRSRFNTTDDFQEVSHFDWLLKKMLNIGGHFIIRLTARNDYHWDIGKDWILCALFQEARRNCAAFEAPHSVRHTPL